MNEADVGIKKPIGLWTAISIGIGGMVGAGIFSILGIAANISGNAMYLSFIIAGIVVLLGSASFLFIYAAVNLAHLRFYKETGAKPFLIWLSIIGCFASLGILVYFEMNNSPLTVAVLGVVIFLAFVAEGGYRKYSQRLLKTRA
jgi:amino acid transporter